jgi:hypothetical protein
MRDISRGLGDKTLEGQMTRLRQIALAGLAAVAIGGYASSASAMQAGTFQNRLNGATIGLPLGALPPAGLYTGIETAYLGLAGQNGGRGNQAGGLAAPAVAQAVPFLYVPGWNFFGGSYGFSVVTAFYMFDVLGFQGNLTTPSSLPVAHGEVLANTFIQPINFSWNLGGGWFIATAFGFMVPDGSRWVGTPNPDYWTIEPSVAISYLGSNWVASANFFYDINFQSNGPCCVAVGLTGGGPITSGNALYGDFTAVYKIGKWEIGPVAYFEVQTTNDSGPGCSIAGNCGKLETFDLGGLVGYDFGPVDMQFWITQSVHRQDAIDGLTFWSRIGFKLWGPAAPAPLVTKN